MIYHTQRRCVHGRGRIGLCFFRGMALKSDPFRDGFFSVCMLLFYRAGGQNAGHGNEVFPPPRPIFLVDFSHRK